jgi:hypothetical protein
MVGGWYDLICLLKNWQLDRKPESWKVCCMKTTLDLPEELVREMKIRAAREGRKLRDVATEIIQRGISSTEPTIKPKGKRVKLPFFQGKKPINPADELTPDKIHDILMNQEIEWLNEINETAGR